MNGYDKGYDILQPQSQDHSGYQTREYTFYICI